MMNKLFRYQKNYSSFLDDRPFHAREFLDYGKLEASVQVGRLVRRLYLRHLLLNLKIRGVKKWVFFEICKSS